MKLSEAILLGEIAYPRNDGSFWTEWDRQGNLTCGCAMGRAYAANGGTAKEYSVGYFAGMWQWVTDGRFPGRVQGMVSFWFLDVLRGDMTMDQLVEEVRKIEPSCGECNRFECSCVKSEASPVAIEEAACSD